MLHMAEGTADLGAESGCPSITDQVIHDRFHLCSIDVDCLDHTTIPDIQVYLLLCAANL